MNDDRAGRVSTNTVSTPSDFATIVIASRCACNRLSILSQLRWYGQCGLQIPPAAVAPQAWDSLQVFASSLERVGRGPLVAGFRSQFRGRYGDIHGTPRRFDECATLGES